MAAEEKLVDQKTAGEIASGLEDDSKTKLSPNETGGLYASAMDGSSESDPVSRVTESDENQQQNKLRVGEFDGFAGVENTTNYTCTEALDGSLEAENREFRCQAGENDTMARKRVVNKPGKESEGIRDSNNGQSSTGNSRRSSRSNSRAKSSPFGLKTYALVVLFCVLSFGWLYYQQILANRVNTPLDVVRVIASDEGSLQQSQDRFWGTYRPGVYFGKI